MSWVRTVYCPLAWLFVTAIALQFLLAGLAVLGGGSIVPHRGLGMLLMLAGLLLFALALLLRLGARVIVASLSLLALLVLQAVFVQADVSPAWLRSLHVLDALFIAALGGFLALRPQGAGR